jgi:hypothetical protein
MFSSINDKGSPVFPTRFAAADPLTDVPQFGAQDELSLPQDFDWVHPADKAIERRLRKRLNSVAAVLKAAAGVREPLGELLVLAGRISREQLEVALCEGALTGEKLGDVLIGHGWIDLAERDAALAFQRNQSGDDGPLRLGNLLVAIGIITQAQLHDAIARQRESGRRLGNVLVESGYAKSDEILRGLSLQRRLVKTALTALFALCTLGTATMLALQPGDAAAASAMGTEKNGRTQASASLDFMVKIPSVLRVNYLMQPHSLTIDENDVERGYVDVPPETHIEVFTNNKDGFLVTFRGRFDIVRKVLIRGLAHLVEIDAMDAGATVRHRSRAPDGKLELGYRFILASGTKPGTYPWPMAISAGTQY